MSTVMTCDGAQSQFWLLQYGELTFDEEERVETHLEGCAECRAKLEREKDLFAAFDSVSVEPSPSLLRQCRADLAARLEFEPAPQTPRTAWWEQFTHALSGGMVLRPAGALALLAIGFAGARLMPTFLHVPGLGVA